MSSASSSWAFAPGWYESHQKLKHSIVSYDPFNKKQDVSKAYKTYYSLIYRGKADVGQEHIEAYWIFTLFQEQASVFAARIWLAVVGRIFESILRRSVKYL